MTAPPPRRRTFGGVTVVESVGPNRLHLWQLEHQSHQASHYEQIHTAALTVSDSTNVTATCARIPHPPSFSPRTRHGFHLHHQAQLHTMKCFLRQFLRLDVVPYRARPFLHSSFNPPCPSLSSSSSSPPTQSHLLRSHSRWLHLACERTLLRMLLGHRREKQTRSRSKPGMKVRVAVVSGCSHFMGRRETKLQGCNTTLHCTVHLFTHCTSCRVCYAFFAPQKNFHLVCSLMGTIVWSIPERYERSCSCCAKRYQRKIFAVVLKRKCVSRMDATACMCCVL